MHRVRDTVSPFPVLVGGTAAELVDTKAALGSRLPLALAVMALVTFVILFLFTGSVLVPVKAVVLNVRQPDSDIRRHGLGLPGRAPLRAAGLHRRPAPWTTRSRS